MTDERSDDAPRLAFGRREFLVGATLAGTSGLGYLAQPQVANRPVPDKTFQSWIPNQFADWQVQGRSGVVLPPPDALVDRLYDNLVTRVYANEQGVQVMMLIAYNFRQDGVLQLHRPEFCYPAGGFTLTATRPVDLSLGGLTEVPASAFTATNAVQTEQVLYFTRLGDSFPRRWIEQRLSVLKANLQGDIPDGVMMRVSVLDPDAGHAQALLQGFLGGFFKTIPGQLRRLLINSNG
ncbi:exosortase-associated protein EpsI, V-type [Novosphingobium piscinae]|uniref:EpsI family protein n=1 Tax=Novosphingobium piscinae TaxID=1507448 RepID=A0A7X1FXG2_9SPHN|nr:exosortase-associated protein EpsI, V-type [Novosphingobium piscinae]MBC2668137.1 EpsI family protein [Novosphingobium piscinae]